MRFFDELKRRHVVRVVIAYAVVGWALIEISSTIIPALHLPDSLTTAIVVLVLLGFPVAVVLAWAFEMTPDGVRRTEPADSPEARAPEQASRVGRYLNTIIIGVLALAVVVLLWQKFAPSRVPAERAPATASAKPATIDKPVTAPVANAIPNKSIAVLPFENLSEDKANGYFADGIQDQILSGLAKIGDLKVISRTSTQRYASRPDNVTEIARELGVAHILEGSVQKAGNRVRINVQLIKVGSGKHLWAETYDRDLKDIFAVESEVAEKIATMYWFGFDPAGEVLKSAKANLDRAIALAPQLPQVEMARGVYLYYGKRDFTAALAVILQVRKKLPRDSEVWYFSGLLERRLGLWGAAATDFEHAIALSPNVPYISNDLAITLLSMHQYKRAVKSLDAGLALEVDDPALLNIRLWAAWNLEGLDGADRILSAVHSEDAAINSYRAQQALYRRDYASSSSYYRRAIAADDGVQLSGVLLGYVPSSLEWRLRLALSGQLSGSPQVAAGIYRELRDKAQRALVSKPDNRNIEGAWRVVLARALAGLGQHDEALTQGRQAMALNPEDKDRFKGPAWQDQMATILAMNGDAARAVPWLQHLLSTEGFTTRFVLRTDPVYDPIRHDPGFQALLKQTPQTGAANE